MDELKKFLIEKGIKYDIGIIDSGQYHKLSEPIENEQVIRFMWKKCSINKLIEMLKTKGIKLKASELGKYTGLYDIDGTNNKVFIIYGVDSHIQLPMCLLKNFRTKERLYYINIAKNEIINSSARNYNTKFGYYSLFFEEYMSNHYEQIIVDLINTVMPFINHEIRKITIINLNDKINKLFLMALFRNPKYVEEINKKSIFAQIIDGGYNSEFLALIGEEKINFIKGYTPVPLVNDTSKGMVTVRSLVSNLKIDNGIECMVMTLHPKFAIALVPNHYFKRMIEEQDKKTYLQIDKGEELLRMNKQIYYNAKYNRDEVIGLKSDLEDLISL